MEPGETPQQSLQREIRELQRKIREEHQEIREELDAEIEIGKLIRTIEWDCPAFHLAMHCF